MISILKKINRFIRKWLFVLSRISAVTKFANDPKMAYTYYPGEQGKSKARIWLELVWWLIKYAEVNIFYYSYGFDTKRKVKQSDYISLNDFKDLRNSRNDAVQIGRHTTSYLVLLKDKFTFYLLLSSLGFPTPRVLGLCLDDRIHWLDTRTTEGIDSLMKRPRLHVFCKTILGECAEGAFPLRTEGETLLLDGAPVTLAGLTERLRGGFIIQEFIEQHPRMAELYPPCINSMRINTIRKGNEVVLFSSCMKIGANGLTRDNWVSDGLFGVIDRKTGRLAKEFKFQPGCGGIVTKHPQTGVVFEGCEIPFYQEAVRLSIELHTLLYGIHSIGWDVAITKDGPTFIEGNDKWGIAAHQAVEGGLKARFLAAFEPLTKGTSCFTP